MSSDKSIELYTTERRIEKLRAEVNRLGAELSMCRQRPIPELINFLESTARDYPTPAQYERDLAEHIRLARG